MVFNAKHLNDLNLNYNDKNILISIFIFFPFFNISAQIGAYYI